MIECNRVPISREDVKRYEESSKDYRASLNTTEAWNQAIARRKRRDVFASEATDSRDPWRRGLRDIAGATAYEGDLARTHEKMRDQAKSQGETHVDKKTVFFPSGTSSDGPEIRLNKKHPFYSSYDLARYLCRHDL